jgi:pimeloyl-ACP methyl ester carboxylesterase
VSLASTRVASDTEASSRTLVMLHGIYGRGRNWQAIARGIVAARPDYACWLVDLPSHGDSPPGRHGDSVRGFARDLGDWLVESGITPDVVLGHSYGGKVALALAGGSPSALDTSHSAPCDQVWVIDSTPEVKAPSGSAWEMLQIVRALPARFATRDEAVSAIVAKGFTVGVGQWMATNLARDGDAFVWRLDFDRMERLLHDFFRADLWPIVEDRERPTVLHFLKATRSSAMSDEAAARLRALDHPRVHLHEREGGHWIHAEAPDVVTALLAEHLP